MVVRENLKMSFTAKGERVEVEFWLRVLRMVVVEPVRRMYSRDWGRVLERGMCGSHSEGVGSVV